MDDLPEKRCYYCGVRGAMTRDHYLPKAMGGEGGDNLVLCCRPCNAKKRAMLGGDYVAWLTTPEGRAWFHQRGFHTEIVDNACPQCISKRDNMRRKWVAWSRRKHPDAPIRPTAPP